MIEFLKALFCKRKLEKASSWFEKHEWVQERFEEIEDWLEEVDEKLDLIIDHLEIDVDKEGE